MHKRRAAVWREFSLHVKGFVGGSVVTNTLTDGGGGEESKEKAAVR